MTFTTKYTSCISKNNGYMLVVICLYLTRYMTAILKKRVLRLLRYVL
nr:MAG TPA_asm: hypothetical protein [Caudoviricetes sp.]